MAGIQKCDIQLGDHPREERPAEAPPLPLAASPPISRSGTIWPEGVRNSKTTLVRSASVQTSQDRQDCCIKSLHTSTDHHHGKHQESADDQRTCSLFSASVVLAEPGPVR